MKSASTLGVNPNTEREQEDYYATNPNAVLLFLENLGDLKLNNNLWECACGEGHISKILLKKGYNVKSSDLINRGFGEQQDFLKYEERFDGDIITNPPFILAEDFIKKAIEVLKDGNKLILLMKIQFLESESRYNLFKKYPLKYIYVHSSRQLCSRKGDFENYKSTTLCYCWYVWEKGFNGETIIRWIKPKLEVKQEAMQSEARHSSQA